VAVVGLRKSFASSKGRALDRTCLSLVEGELTVLMGQNGAGKTSLISCLTGRLRSDGGSAHVYGHDVTSSQGALRQSLGVCPQEDALFEGFTPTEVLAFYADLKGVPLGEQPRAVQDMLVQMGLASHDPAGPLASQRAPASMRVEALSGGQRRRVSIGVALIGDSKFVVLDEPTSAMDPLGKHQTWALLRRLRRGRTILLTTHLMDEADAVADRVAVMCLGRVFCAGSPAFLKRKLGKGYTLTLARDDDGTGTSARSSGLVPVPPSSSDASSDAASVAAGTQNSDAVTAVAAWVQGRLGNCGVARRSSGQVRLTLPFALDAAAFFRDLDAHLKQRDGTGSLAAQGGCGVTYGLEMPSLESVFLRVTSQALGVPNPEDQAPIDYEQQLQEQLPPGTMAGTPPGTSDAWLLWRQARAVCVFRLHVAVAGEPWATLGRGLPQALAFGLGAVVLAEVHSLNDRARCSVVAAMALTTLFRPGAAAAALLLERQRGLRHLLAVSGCASAAFWGGTFAAELVLALGPAAALWPARVPGWSDSPWFYAATAGFALHSATFGAALSFGFPTASAASLFAPGAVLVGTLVAPSLAVLGLHWALPAAVPALPAALAATLCVCSPHLLFAAALTALHAPGLGAPSAPLCVGLQLVLSAALASGAVAMERGYSARVHPTGRLVAVDASGQQVAAASAAAEQAGDEDVCSERLRARRSRDPNVVLRLVGLRKEYASTSSADGADGPGADGPGADGSGADGSGECQSFVRVAVQGLSVVVRRGECVGLLGPNGAGKSTAIGLLTRLVRPSEGDATVCGHSVLTAATQAFQHLGLVPQDMVTGRFSLSRKV
jgi:ABC-type multidrug transport system ATPase subunit